MNKIKKLWQNKFFKNWFLLTVVFTLIELIFRWIEHYKVLSYASLRIWIGINIITLLFSLILEFLPNLVSKIWNMLITGVISIYALVELGFNNFLGVYASLGIKSQAGAVTNLVFDFLRSFYWYYYLILIPFVLLIIYYIFLDKKVSLDMPKRKKDMKYATLECFKVLLIVFLGFCYFATLKINFMQNKLQKVTSYELFKNPSNPTLTVNEFGIGGFGLLDIREYLFPSEEETAKFELDLSNLQNLNNVIEEKEERPHLTVDNDIWQDIIEKETNNTYNNLNKYFMSNHITKTNEYTALFENKNVIVIMVESGSNLMLKEEYYPNIAKLYNGGWTWDNYYSPRNSCSTGNNEMSGMTGLYTIYNNCTANTYKNNTYFESMFNLFNNKGYNTNSFHDNYDEYYARTTIHKNMGSNTFYKLQDMHLKSEYAHKDWASDEEMMEFYLKTLDEREDTETPFMSWITTVTSHLPYSVPSVYNNEHLKMFPEEIPLEVRRYMSKLKVVDNSLGILLDGLKERNLLEDTVIVLYCDHYPYALSTNNLNKVYDFDISIDGLTDQVPFIIYNSSLTNKHFKEYTSYVNILPTVANLFNLDYDSRLYMGSDILDDSYESLVVFADGSWKNEKAYYSISSSNIKYYTEFTYTDEEILAINDKVGLKLKMSNTAIKNNYFNYLDKKLNSYNSTE